MYEIEFDDEAKWSIKLDCYIMWATVEHDRVRCLISNLVFTDCLDNPDATAKDFPEMFKRYRQIFELAFRNLIRAGAYTQPQDDWDGLQVMLSTSNFGRHENTAQSGSGNVR
jgi:Protein of unknown function (DUF1488)